MTTQELRKMEFVFTEDELNSEVWKPIKDFEDYYDVSSLGRFRSKDRRIIRHNGIIENKPKRILKNNYYSNGYVQLILYVEKVRFNFLAHRVIAEHFIENPLDGGVVNHKNMIKWDNRVSNLEWCTHKQNIQHAYLNKTWDRNTAFGERVYNSKITNEEALYIKKNFNKDSKNKELYALFKDKIARSTMNKIGRNYTWKHIVV
jgi:hypothetical protein